MLNNSIKSYTFKPLIEPIGVLNTVSIELYRASGCEWEIAVLALLAAEVDCIGGGFTSIQGQHHTLQFVHWVVDNLDNSAGKNYIVNSISTVNKSVLE